MSYLDVFYSRINHLGTTTSERIRGGGIRSFDKWLAQSPHTVLNLFTEKNSVFFDGIILTSKDKEYEKIMFLNVRNNVPIHVGDIVNWTLDDGSIEKWIIFQKEKKVNQTYQTFLMVRCNYLMRWIDDLGHIQESWSYFVSSLDSKIKGNFRTWNSLISPQPNKYAEILMPRQPISRATNFIVEEESWTVVEYDHTSVPGIIYLSLTEGKINTIYDDVQNNLADTDRIADYQLNAPQNTQEFNIGEIHPIFSLMKNGLPCEEQVVFIPEDKTMIDFVGGILMAKTIGDTFIRVQLKNYPQISVKLPIHIIATDINFSAFIDGPSTICLDREQIYTFKANDTLTGDVQFFIDNIKFAKIINKTKDTCTILANNKNQLGSFILTAKYNSNEYTKTITVAPLW